MKGPPGRKEIQNTETKQNKKHVPQPIWLHLTREGRVTDWQALKSMRGHDISAKSLNPELPCSPREAMLDEDGYITLNIKNRKPALTPGKNTRNQGFGS